MSEPILKHYRYGGNLSHIGCEVLPSGKEITVVIDRVAWVEKEQINGETKPAWIAYFKPNPYFTLPMVLNATNKRRLARLSGTPYLETVKNLPVTLCQEMDRVYGGKKDDKDWALRISRVPPKVNAQGQVTKIKLDPSCANWASIIKWVQDGGDIESVWKKYDVSEEDKMKFKEELEEKK